MKVLFINPRDEFLENAGDRPPLGLGYLCSYVKSIGYEANIADSNHDDLYPIGYDYYCIAVSTPNYLECLSIGRSLKEKEFGKIIFGGNHITDFPDQKETKEVADYWIVGDGEDAMNRILAGEAKKGLVLSKPVLNLDELPMPDYKALKFERYTMTVDGKKGASMVTARGCMYNCAFCGSAKIKKVRQRSPENVIEEMKFLYKEYGIRGFYFGDDIFTWNRERCLKLCNLIKDTFEDVLWRATTRADLVDKELLLVMKETGCSVISLGCESGNNEILLKIHKGMTVEQNREAVGWAHEVGLKVKAFFIIGLPGETKETAMKTIEYAKSLNLDYADFYPYTPYPSTPIWDNPEKYEVKVRKPEVDEWISLNQVKSSNFILEHPNLSQEEIGELIELAQTEVMKNKGTY